ncbi:hypothetical protein CerSpe_125810 [Prunus speciosa]
MTSTLTSAPSGLSPSKICPWACPGWWVPVLARAGFVALEGDLGSRGACCQGRAPALDMLFRLVIHITNANADFHTRVIESVRDGVKNLKPGDHVRPVFTGECGDCLHRKSKENHMCDLLRINADRGVMIGDGKQRFFKNGTPINHFLGTSTFSEYTVIHEGCLAKIDPSAPLDKVCILSCGVSTGLGATLNVAKPKKGSSVAVFGLGAVGLAAAEGARISGAPRIIGVDLNPKRLEEAKNFGVNEFVNPRDEKL